MRRTRSLGTLAFAAVCLFTLAGGAAAPTASANDVATTQSKAESVAQQVSFLDAQLDAAVAAYAAAQQQLADLRLRIERNQRELELAKSRLALAQDALGDRAAAIYKTGDVSFLDAILTTSSFGDLLTQADYMRRLSANDSSVVDAVSSYRDAVAARSAQLQSDLAKAQSLADQRAQQRSAIAASLRDRQQKLQGVRADLAALRAAATQRAAAASQADQGGGVQGGSGGLYGQGPWWPVIQQVAASNGIWDLGLYRLMMAESGGVATAGNGVNFGLFQYSRGTWAGSWNPWRKSSIFDGAAQVRATGLAIARGYGPKWWAATYAYAFAR